jgi:hypothetical protein
VIAWHSSEPQVCRRVSSLKHSYCTLSDVSRARCSSTSSSSRRSTFYKRSLVLAQAEESAVEFFTSTQDIRSSASHSNRATRSSAPLI